MPNNQRDLIKHRLGEHASYDSLFFDHGLERIVREMIMKQLKQFTVHLYDPGL
jgi:hypothetical protein